MKDALQKEMLFKHFCAMGWYSQPEIALYHGGGLDEAGKLISDIDVLAFRPTSDLRWAKVLGDCKTLRSTSPANRAAWLHGMMTYSRSNDGILILKKSQRAPIEQDHKLFARSMNVTLLDESEFTRYDRAICYPLGSAGFPISTSQILEIRNVKNKFPRLSKFVDFLYVESWNEPCELNRMRKILGQARGISKEIDPRRKDHIALVLEAIGMFAVCLATTVGLVFNQFLCPDSQTDLDQALRVIIWGGKSNYQFFAEARRALIQQQGLEIGDDNPLSLPAWEDFLQLVRSLLECPGSAFRIPQLLQRCAVDISEENKFLGWAASDPISLIDIKNAMSASSYLCKAAKFPEELRSTLRQNFALAQSELVEKRESLQSTVHG